ncbi:MAG: TIGR02757 family protein [Bacteroidales bacterium]|nr:TIGR02757 family protein [Bacteroidales bacterium]
MTRKTVEQMIAWAEQYNDPRYFEEDPLAFPKEFVRRGSSLQDIEIAAVFSSHLAWGRRSMIVRDCTRLFDEMEWRPYDYVMAGSYRDDETSLHRTVKWSEAAGICGRLREWYTWHKSLESLSAKEIRAIVFRRKEDPSAPDKKINLMRRWLVRRDGKVDLGLWTNTDPASLLVPLDVHVHAQASALGLTKRRSKDMKTALEITDRFREIWPEDPLLGDFALFGYGVTHSK